MSEPPTIQDPATARLPVAYEAAQKALAQCSRVDECKDWADRAAALASYARQAKDDSLRVMATRIQERAMRRGGVLLKQIAPANGANQNIKVGADPKVTRESVAAAAGLSERQRKNAIRLANIPADEFERAVESSSPPTLEAMARWGTIQRPAPIGTASPGALNEYSKACESLVQFARFCDRTDPAELARSVQVEDIEAMREYVATADRWLDRFVTNLESENEAA